MTKSLDLSDTAQEALAELLEEALRDLSYEIFDTDLYSCKQELKSRRDELNSIADQPRRARTTRSILRRDGFCAAAHRSGPDRDSISSARAFFSPNSAA
jgi:hypothetical protein